MLNIDLIKNKIRSVVVNKISPIDGLLSITFVGSFESSTDISLISDIDIIIIVDELYESKFKEIEVAAASIKGVDIGLEDYSIKLNMTFGPLKFNNDETVVFHIMVYDVFGHRKHVLESPFTCLDWEYFPAIYGKNLSEIYPASGVQLIDLVGSRRGLEAYLDDLKKQVISYRVYDFSVEPYSEKKHTIKMDDRHQKEYAYHVLKFLQLNLIKILFQLNNRYTISELSDVFSSLDISFKKHSSLLLELHKWKYENANEPYEIFKRLDFFIDDLKTWINNLTLNKLIFFRHGKTELNDGSFLGVRRNPSIINPLDIFCDDSFEEVHTGTLARTIETGKLLKSKVLYQNELLNEIDYGIIEGITLNELNDRYPELIQSWQKKEDPRFPEGESQTDVSNRLKNFISNTIFKSKTAIVSHNVVLRTLLGNLYNQPVYNWYKINPNHLEAHNFYVFNDVLIPNFSKEQQQKYKDELVGYKGPINKYGVFWIPCDELKNYVDSCKDRFRKVEPDAIFLNHPVHSTIFLFNAFEQDQSKIIKRIKNKKIDFLVDTWKIFENDVVTQGDTLSIGLVSNHLCFDFQKDLAESLLYFIKKPVFYNNIWEGQYKESYDRYGFPFVGSHWIPHLTIASVKKQGKKLLDEIKTTTINLNQRKCIGNLALYKIIGEKHQLVHVWQ
jgi:alpha-ribazole phosphatase/probable phosphoglycerate mutase